MTGVRISNLPTLPVALGGTESVPLVQAGVTYRTTVGGITGYLGMANVLDYGAVVDGANSTGVAEAVAAAVAAGYTQIFLPANCWYYPVGGETPEGVEIWGEDWETTVISAVDRTTEYIAVGAHGKLFNVGIVSKFGDDIPEPDGEEKTCPVGTAINQSDTAAIITNWPYMSLWVYTGRSTNPGGTTADDVPIIGINNGGQGDSFFSTTTSASLVESNNIHVQTAGIDDRGVRIVNGAALPSNLHTGIEIVEQGTNTGSSSIIISRETDGPAGIQITDALGGSGAVTANGIVGVLTRQSTGAFFDIFQATQAYDGDFLYVNAGNSGGTFSGNFLNLSLANVSVFSVDNEGKTLTQGVSLPPRAAPSNPSTGWILYTDSGDSNKLKAKASNGTTVTLGTP